MKAALAVKMILAAASASPFSFVAYGDTAYQLPRDQGRLEGLIDEINAQAPAFAIHVGDFKGYTSCDDAAYAAMRSNFARHNHPVVLSLGDNDWFDCSVESAGGFDPFERLGVLRRLFFSDRQSLGGTTVTVERQNAAYPEHARWRHQGLIFVTINAFGPHNGLIRDPKASAESAARSTAGDQWIRAAFRLARSERAPGLVIAFQADPWLQSAPQYENGPFDWLRNVIGEESATFEGQVLVVHGDSHRLTIDTPYRRADVDAGTTRGMNVTRLQVPGWPDHRAVRVDVDPSSSSVFRFEVVMSKDEISGAKP